MRPASITRLSPFQIGLCAAIGATCIAVGIYGQVLHWQLDAQGFSPLGKRLPYWDFSNLWAGSRMALQGETGLLFDTAGFRREMDAIFGVRLPDQEWSYPPSFLLIGAPLALLPIGAAFLLWSTGTLFLFHRAILPFRLPLLAHIFVLLSPAFWSNQMFGQNGMLTAALLIGGLAAVPARPVLGGILLGLLTAKPHLGILVPFCLLAGGHGRAFAAAAATAALTVTATGFLFGFEVWTLFLTQTRPLMTAIMEMPYPQAFHTHAATVFILLRSLGAGLGAAYAGQAVVTASAVLAAAWLWRPANGLDHLSRVALTGVLVIVATPYGYTHDTAPVYLAAAWFFLREREPRIAIYAMAWLYAMIFPSFHAQHIAAGVVGPLLFAGYLLARHAPPARKREPAAPEAIPRLAPATAS